MFNTLSTLKLITHGWVIKKDIAEGASVIGVILHEFEWVRYKNQKYV